MSHDPVVVCSVLPGNRVRVQQTSDAFRTFAALRGGDAEVSVDFIPVAALDCTGQMFTDATSWVLPAVKPIGLGAFLFHRVGIPDSVRRAVLHHYDVVPVSVAAGLMTDWFRAVERAKEAPGPD